jgi:hypothetical protein
MAEDESMKRETDQLDYVVLGNTPKITLEGEKVTGYQERKDREASELVEATLFQISREKARFSLLGPKNVFDKNSFTSDKAISELLAKEVPVDDPEVEKHEITSEEDFIEDATTAGGKALIAAESTSDPVIKSRLEDFVKKIVKETSAFLAEPKKKALGAVAIIATVATACSAKVSPTVNPPPEGIKTQTSEVSPTQVPPTEIATQTATATEQPTATEDELAGVNIFDTSTFPDKYKSIAEDPTSSTEEQQNEYQDFLHRARQKFFADKGILGLVNQMETSGKIDPEVADIWGLMYAQQNPDKLKDPSLVEGKRIILGPAELRKADALDDNDRFSKWTDNVTIGGKIFLTDYGQYPLVNVNPQYSNLNVFGVEISNHYGGGSMNGVLGGIASVDENPNDLVVLILMKDPKGIWVIVPRLTSTDAKFTLPKGSVCRENTTEWYVLPEDVPYGPISDNFSKAIPETQLFASLGLRINTKPYSNLFDDWTNQKEMFFQLAGGPCFTSAGAVIRQTTIFPAYKPPVWDDIASSK